MTKKERSGLIYTRQQGFFVPPESVLCHFSAALLRFCHALLVTSACPHISFLQNRWVGKGMGAGANALRVLVGLRPKIPIDEQLRNACFFGQADVVEQILLSIPHGPGGPVDAQDPIGYTPIMYAAGSGYPQILEMLLQHGAAMNHVAHNGFTALHKAAEGGKIACLNVLLVWRADMNIQSVEGYSPAMCAVMEKKDIFLKRLIEAKCDLTLRDNKGNTALDLVKHGGTIEILEEGMQLRTGLEEQRRTILVEKRLLLQQKLKETRERGEAEKKAKLVREEAALKSSTERALQEMAEQAKRDNETFHNSLLEQQLQEQAALEARRLREAEIQRARSEGAAERRIRIPTLAAFLSLQVCPHFYPISGLLSIGIVQKFSPHSSFSTYTQKSEPLRLVQAPGM